MQLFIAAILRIADAAGEWWPTITFGRQLTRVELEEHIESLVRGATESFRQKYDAGLAELLAATTAARESKAAHDAAALRYARSQGVLDSLVARGFARQQAVLEGWRLRN